MARKKQKKGKKNFVRKLLTALAIILLIGGGIVLQRIYHLVYQPNVLITADASPYFFIPTGSDYRSVIQSLSTQGYIKNANTLEWIAERKNYKNNVKAGRYKLKQGMSNNELIDLLRSGEQSPVRLTFHNIRDKRELADLVGEQLETNPDALYRLLNSNEFASKYGFNRATIMTLFIPNTYEFHWNTSAEEFVKRMATEYKRFWTDSRKEKAKRLNLSQSEVSILASIVQAEQTIRRDERPKVAGLYINRLRKNMRLESDPTIIFAIGDFNIKRVLKADRNTNSPYNTYKNKGLPPGPINLPEMSSIDAVLDYEKHDYIFMCAKEDFSGYHNFAKTYREHQIYARRYQQELNKRKIYR